MWIPWAWASSSLLLAAGGGAATLFRSSLLILGEEGLEEEIAAGGSGVAELLSAVRDPATRHPFSLWVVSSVLKASAALCAGIAAGLFAAETGGWRAAAIIGGTILLLLLVLFFLEHLANRRALADSRRVLRRGGRACRFALGAGAIPSRLLDRLGRLLFGSRYSPEALMDIRFGSEEGILDMIEEGAEHGTIDSTEEKMIERVLRFGEADVNEVMTPWSEVVTLRQGMTAEEVALIASNAGFSRYPVLSRSGEEVVGILSMRHLLRPSGEEGWERYPGKPVYVPDSMKVADLLRRFQRTRVHMAVVIDEHGKLCGVTTVHDLLEVIVGRLAEGAETAEIPEWEKDGTLSVPGSTPVRMLREEYGIQIPLGETYETAAGFALDCLQGLPEGVVTFLAYGYRITIVETERFRIRRLRFEKTDPTGIR
jgi:CBS domain containing-hemolysin-like protein